jgi:hypothetical protein
VLDLQVVECWEDGSCEAFSVELGEEFAGAVVDHLLVMFEHEFGTEKFYGGRAGGYHFEFLGLAEAL